MPELLLASAGDFPFVVRGERVDRVVEVPSISRPMRLQRPDLIAAVVDERVLYFSDLTVRLDVGEPLSDRGTGLLLHDGGAVVGIAVASPPKTIQVSEDDLIPVDPSVGRAVIDSCVRIDGRLVPLLSEGFLGSLDSEVPEQWSPGTDSHATAAEIDGTHLVEARAAGRRIALRHGDPAPVPVRVEQTVIVPGAPPYMAGLALFGGAMHPVLGLAQILGLGAAAPDPVVFAWTSADRVLLIVADALESPLPTDVTIVELPPLLRDGSIGHAALVDGSVLPVVDLHAVLATRDSGAIRERRTERSYRLDSDFPSRFLAAEVTVHEFALGQSVYAIPENELAELETSSEVVPLAAAGALVSGAVRVDDRVVPVIDLPAYLGYRIDGASTEAGLLVQNGDFEAAFFPHRSLGRRSVEASIQRELPLASTRPFVYGCYVDGSDVRLILNVALIAQFAQDPAAQQALAGLAPSAAATADARRVEAAAGGTADATDASPGTDEASEPAAGLAQPPTETAGGAPIADAADDTPSAETADDTSTTETALDSSTAEGAGGAATAWPECGAEAPSTPTPSPSEAPPNEQSTPVPSSHESPLRPPSRDGAASASGSEPAAAEDSPRRSRRPLAIILLLLLLATIAIAGIVLVPEMIDRAAPGGGAGEQPEGAGSPAAGQSQGEPPATSEAGAEESALPRRASLRVSFDGDSAELQPAARTALDRFVDEFSDRTVAELAVVGHAARFGSEVSSQALSEERARVTAAYLVERLEGAPESVVVRGAGAREPIADNDTEAGRSANRRAEVEVVFE